ncbi:MAG: TIGR03621 family F420-dependent LLM class oxidoreductase [Deltaproteobacteria bacterium]|nr:TIGR03621 family F420-dependent LLM class oxidoreductase [Deltaproteobacteria bacterium]MBW2419478.1 TIGR03621 family F420-dependent LLM class oxidoreductase [Deltaproteobacteria bacterium]
MSVQRPFRFGVQSFSASSAREWRDRAKRAEELGYAVLSLADHFIGPGPAQEATGHPPQELAAVPAIAVAAEATTELRVGCRVFCVDYRHPVMLAKEAATLDLLSEGRVEIGMGAGWIAGEYAAADIPFEAAGVRIAKLAEAVTLMKALMAEGQTSFAGKYFRVEGFEGKPKPVQRPHPPIMIGGGGERVLGLAAREADIVSFNFNNRSGVLGADGVQSSTAELTAQKVEWVKKAAGERFPEIELEIGAYFTFVGDQSDAMAEGMAGVFGLSKEAMREHPHALFGSVDAICDELQRRREQYGISYVTVGDAQMVDFAPVVARLAGS